MSEYQFYEWQTIDRPLTATEQAEAEALSSHIAVTSTRAWVEYHWGGFRHDPLEALARYFDAFLYYAGWGDQRLAFRFPAGLLREADLQPYLRECCVELTHMGDCAVLHMAFPHRSEEDIFAQRGDLAALTPLRDDILRGDYRCLYLAWLLAAEDSEHSERELEPPVPAGLGELSPALVEFCDFFVLDEALLRVAAEASPPLQPAGGFPLEEAIARLPADERDEFLLRLARGEPHLSLALNRRLQKLVEMPQLPSAPPERTWRQLRERAGWD
jgi:hypothetical protein